MVYLRILPQLPRPAIPRNDSLAPTAPRCASTSCQLSAFTDQIPGKAYEIEEDPDVSPFYSLCSCQLYIRFSQWEAYDLGRAPESGSGVDLTRANDGAVGANLELARGAGSRYLVQRWGDGTICDRTGKRREIEVQVGN